MNTVSREDVSGESYGDEAATVSNGINFLTGTAGTGEAELYSVLRDDT